MGPMVSAGQRDSVQRYIDGADVAFTGSRPEGDGFWLPPTVVESKSTSEAVWREEVFGPVVAVMAFDDEEEAIALANDTEYGLSGSIFTDNLGRALRVARGVESGNLSVNSHSAVRYWTPFGGYKQSGSGHRAVVEFLSLGPQAVPFVASDWSRDADGGYFEIPWIKHLRLNPERDGLAAVAHGSDPPKEVVCRRRVSRGNTIILRIASPGFDGEARIH